MDKGWWHPLPNTEDELKRFQDLPLTGQPFVVRIEQGKVRTIIKRKIWWNIIIMNILKGTISKIFFYFAIEHFNSVRLNYLLALKDVKNSLKVN